eukprot:m.164073 g.164073  ORF g.164073 m.164073 type:complete len:392 (-) comp12376_c0_seq1:380-1555(-)
MAANPAAQMLAVAGSVGLGVLLNQILTRQQPDDGDATPSYLIFRQLFDRESCTYTYLLADAKTKEAVLIDPVDTLVDRDLGLIDELGLTLTHCLNTHVHADHITGSGLIKERLTSVKSVLGSGAKPAIADEYLDDGDTLAFGAFHLMALSTPGHTDSCTSYVLGDSSRVFTGDTLFVRGCGRTDFQQGSSDKLYDSVHKKLFTLPDACAVYPAHDYKGRTVSTIGEEKRFNPRLTKSKEEFIELMSALNLSDPKMIDVAVPGNQACGYRMPDPYKVMTPEQIAARLRLPNSTVIDLRTDEELVAAPAVCHGVGLDVASTAEAPGAIDEAVRSGHLGNKYAPIIVYCRSGRRAGAGCEKLQALGYICIANAGSRENMEKSCKLARLTCTREH